MCGPAGRCGIVSCPVFSGAEALLSGICRAHRQRDFFLPHKRPYDPNRAPLSLLAENRGKPLHPVPALSSRLHGDSSANRRSAGLAACVAPGNPPAPLSLFLVQSTSPQITPATACGRCAARFAVWRVRRLLPHVWQDAADHRNHRAAGDAADSPPPGPRVDRGADRASPPGLSRLP